MITALPLDPSIDRHIEVAKMWNAFYLDSGINRYFTLGAAEMDAEQYQASWGLYCRFEVVDRQKWHEGWV
jgi:hypothetical protein